MDRDTLFFELGNEDGIIYAEEVFSGTAYVHIVVFNRRRLPDLEGQIKGLVEYGFWAIPSLQYISGWIPAFNAGGRGLMERLGWNLDGVLRGAMCYGGKRVDAHVYSISREEAFDGRV